MEDIRKRLWDNQRDYIVVERGIMDRVQYSYGLILVLMFSLFMGPAVAEEEEEPPIPISEYMALGKEPFKVNLSGKGEHVMVLHAQVYVTTQRAKDGIKLHLPKIQNDVLELLGEQSFKKMKKTKHKKKLRKKVLKLIRKVMEERQILNKPEKLEEVAEVIFTQVLLQ